MGQALYRKYRSKSLGEIVGQEHITDTLAQAVKSGRVSHAYLFTGPRGVGKTSIARILAHEINGLEYKHEDNHIDIIEIDAASNRGIDEIRDLREKVYMAPVAAKFKVYIIDEVHMLTTQAFNALLKTLEEPPEHAVFILATTEAHKLPETIISRTQQYIFKPVEAQKVIDHLRSIAKTEKIAIDDDALALFAAHGGGSFRDSISLLDQAGNSATKITRETAESMLGIPSEKAVAALLQAIAGGDGAVAVQQIEQLQNGGYHPAAIAKQLGALLRSRYLDKASPLDAATTLQLLTNLLDVAPAHEPVKVLELAVLKAMPAAVSSAKQQPTSRPTAPAAPKATKPETAHMIETTPVVDIAPAPAPKPAKTPKAAPSAPQPVEVPEETEPTEPTSTLILDATLWPEILNSLKSQYNTLYGVMRMAVPEFTPGTLTLRFKFAFHQKRMNEAKHRKIVGDIITNLSGQAIAINCVYDKEATLSDSPLSTPAAPQPAPPETAASLSAISNIFGGGELIES
jgi:DNA polymerase-3 subunit gamma/tau